MKRKIAVTGGIGSGKSTVMELLKKWGYGVFSCDQIYRNLLLEKSYIEKLQKLFPAAVVSGKIDTKKLSEIIFNDRTARKQLNDLAHPLIMQKLYADMDRSASNLVFAEVPLLFEGGYEKDFDAIIVVIRHKTERIKSICERDNVTMDEALKKINAQYDYDKNLTSLQKQGAHILSNFSLKNLEKDLEQILKGLS